jgi:hypothetical protein
MAEPMELQLLPQQTEVMRWCDDWRSASLDALERMFE